MNIIKYPIKNYQFTLIIVLMIVLVGVNTLVSMPRAEDPTMKAPKFPVVVIYPGTSPKDMEQLVVKPLESRLYGLDKIKRLKTSINNGYAFIFVEYEHNVDYEGKYQELTRELGAAEREDLPENIYSAKVHKVDPTGVNVIQTALISENASQTTMKKWSSELKSALEKIKPLKEVKVHGLPDPLVRVDLHLGRLAQLKIPINQIMDAIGSEASNIPGGSVHAGQKSMSVKTGGSYQSIEEIKNTIIDSKKGNNISLKDVADVYPDFSQNNHITRLNGYRSLFITAAQKEGMNISETQEKYKKVIADFKTQLPSNIDLVLHFDQADNVNKRLGHLGRDFLIAISLVLLTLLPLGLRASLVVMIAIPLSLSMGIVVLNMFGFSLNQLSIVGFVVALGLLVDDSIVVVENIERWMREGYNRTEAAIKGTKQIAVAVLGCTATLVIAFMPLMFMPDMAGDFIRSMPTAVIGSIVASLFVAILVVPFLATRILIPHKNPKGNVVLRFLQKVIHATYGVWLVKALKKPILTVLIALAIFVGALAMIPILGFSLFPPSEKPQFMVTIHAPDQSNINYSDSITKVIEEDLKNTEKVEYFASNVGKGNPRIYYNVTQANGSEDYADIFVQLNEDVNAEEKMKIIYALREKWEDFLGATVKVKNFEQGVPILSPVEIRLFGDDLDTLRNLAGKAETLLHNTKGTVYINNPVTHNGSDFKVNINRKKAFALGVPTVAIDKTVRLALAGIDVATYADLSRADDDYKIRVTVPRESYPDLSIFDHIMVNNIQGTAIPLNQLATISIEESPSTISHINRSRVVYVNSYVKKGYSNSEVINNVEKNLEQFKMPPGYSYQMGGEVESREESFGGFGTTILVAAFLFIAVLVLEFKTLKSTFIVLSVIPLGIVGAVVALWLTGNNLSFVATIGLVALAGIEVKNTILQVEFTNELRADGKGIVQAAEEAAEIRFLPILLTTMTAIGGLLPIAWSSNPMISPLAIVLIGGLLSSALLSRIITPVVYKLIPPKIGGRT